MIIKVCSPDTVEECDEEEVGSSTLTVHVCTLTPSPLESVSLTTTTSTIMMIKINIHGCKIPSSDAFLP